MRESVIVLCEAASAAFYRAASTCRESGYWTAEYQRGLEFSRAAQTLLDGSSGFHPALPQPEMEGNSKAREGVARKLGELANKYGKVAAAARKELLGGRPC